jgi:hypothetical protein
VRLDFKQVVEPEDNFNNLPVEKEETTTFRMETAISGNQAIRHTTDFDADSPLKEKLTFPMSQLKETDNESSYSLMLSKSGDSNKGSHPIVKFNTKLASHEVMPPIFSLASNAMVTESSAKGEPRIRMLRSREGSTVSGQNSLILNFISEGTDEDGNTLSQDRTKRSCPFYLSPTTVHESQLKSGRVTLSGRGSLDLMPRNSTGGSNAPKLPKRTPTKSSSNAGSKTKAIVIADRGPQDFAS